MTFYNFQRRGTGLLLNPWRESGANRTLARDSKSFDGADLGGTNPQIHRDGVRYPLYYRANLTGLLGEYDDDIFARSRRMVFMRWPHPTFYPYTDLLYLDEWTASGGYSIVQWQTGWSTHEPHYSRASFSPSLRAFSNVTGAEASIGGGSVDVWLSDPQCGFALDEETVVISGATVKQRRATLSYRVFVKATVASDLTVGSSVAPTGTTVGYSMDVTWSVVLPDLYPTPNGIHGLELPFATMTGPGVGSHDLPGALLLSLIADIDIMIAPGSFAGSTATMALAP